MNDKPLKPPPDPKDDIGDSLELFLDDDGDVVDTVLRDKSGVGEAVKRSRAIAEDA